MSQLDEWESLSNIFSLIPLEGKIPIEKDWTRWCHERRPFSRDDFEHRNAGIACGPASGLIVLDIDQPELFKELKSERGWVVPDSLIIKTRQGYHVYFEYHRNGNKYGCTSFKDPKGRINPSNGKVYTIFDVRGIGGQVVAQGSVHPESKEPYKVYRSRTIKPCPQWILDLIKEEEAPRYSTPFKFESAWTGDISDLPISTEVKNMILDGGGKGDRSEMIMSVTNALVYANLTDTQIQDVFENYPIGNKYKEKGRGKTKWLGKHIQKARSYVTTRCDTDKTDFCYRSHSQENVRECVNTNQNNTYNSKVDAVPASKPEKNETQPVDPTCEPDKSFDDKRRRVTTKDDTMTTERRQLETGNDFSKLLIESLLSGGMQSNDVTNLVEIVNKTSEKEFDAPYLENICRQAVVTLSSSVVQRRQVSSKLVDDVRGWVFSADGEFPIGDIFRDLCITSREVKKNTSKILERMQQESLIEKVGTKRGWFRLVEGECSEINFWEESGGSLDLKWPFGIEKLAALYPGNIIVVAGESNAGKTGFLLNFVAKNMWKHKIHFFSSETKKQELNSRLRDFGSIGITFDEWKKARDQGQITFFERDCNFADVIRPGIGNINIIDFLEVYEDFYKVGRYFYEIYRKLNGAIAIIAIQKNTEQSHGLGGARSIEKARLYLSIGYKWMQLMKVKEPIRPFNLGQHPDKHAINFDYIGGCDYCVTKPWFLPKKPEDIKPK